MAGGDIGSFNEMELQKLGFGRFPVILRGLFYQFRFITHYKIV